MTGWIYRSRGSGGLFKVVEINESALIILREIETSEMVLVRKAALRKKHLWEPVGVARSLAT